MKLGAQLYTLHNQTKTLEGFAEALKKVADIGYKSVQVSGTCEFEPEWLAEQLKANGLTCDLTHTRYDRILSDTDAVVREHKLFGCTHIGIGGMPNGFAGYAEFTEKAPAAAEKIAKLGALLMYHNHSFEYTEKIDGAPLLHDLAKKFRPDIMGFTLDTYWVKAGGYDPVEEIKFYSGRLPCVHYKDMAISDGAQRFAAVGDGILDIEKITEAFIDAGTKYAFVEQDDCYGEDPYACLKRSHDYLRSIGIKD